MQWNGKGFVRMMWMMKLCMETKKKKGNVGLLCFDCFALLCFADEKLFVLKENNDSNCLEVGGAIYLSCFASLRLAQVC
jgi:hypothetical protein